VRWGLPALWNPDELAWRVDSALHGELVFDRTEPDFNYPSLPKYVMYCVGKITYGLGYSSSVFYTSVRLVSALLGAMCGVLVYYLARTVGADMLTSALAGVFYVTSGVAAANSRFAHNDLYLQFFSVLCIFSAIKYQLTKSRVWIYSSFFAVGLAASSKYTGGSLLLVPLFVLIGLNWSDFRKSLLQFFGMCVFGGVLSFAGYVLGTPAALNFPAYLKNVIPALHRFSVYGAGYGASIGLFGQWGVFRDAVGVFIYSLFILCFIWFVAKLVLWRFGKLQFDQRQVQAILVLVVAVTIFDLPFLVSVNYVGRFFIPFVPPLSVLGALFVVEVFNLAKNVGGKIASAVVAALLVLGIFYSVLRLVSIALLFTHDARIPASEYIATIRGYKTTVEYTLYPPIVSKKQFYGAARNYPIYFLKYPNEVMPTGGKVTYNLGEQGLLDRDVTYFVIDSFTYDRLYNDTVCGTNPVECDFFRRLLAGRVTTFRLVKDYTYSLPSYLPQVSVSTVNPEIRIYQRVP
jgi:hypothetical protein